MLATQHWWPLAWLSENVALSLGCLRKHLPMKQGWIVATWVALSVGNTTLPSSAYCAFAKAYVSALVSYYGARRSDPTSLGGGQLRRMNIRAFQHVSDVGHDDFARFSCVPCVAPILDKPKDCLSLVTNVVSTA